MLNISILLPPAPRSEGGFYSILPIICDVRVMSFYSVLFYSICHLSCVGLVGYILLYSNLFYLCYTLLLDLCSQWDVLFYSILVYWPHTPCKVRRMILIYCLCYLSHVESDGNQTYYILFYFLNCIVCIFM